MQSVLLLRTGRPHARNVDIVDTQAARCLQQNGNGQFRLQKTVLSRGWQASCLPFHELSAASMVGCAPYWCEQAPVVQSQAARRLARRTLLEAERLPKARIERRVGKNLGCVTPAQASAGTASAGAGFGQRNETHAARLHRCTVKLPSNANATCDSISSRRWILPHQPALRETCEVHEVAWTSNDVHGWTVCLRVMLSTWSPGQLGRSHKKASLKLHRPTSRLPNKKPHLWRPLLKVQSTRTWYCCHAVTQCLPSLGHAAQANTACNSLPALLTSATVFGGPMLLYCCLVFAKTTLQDQANL